MLDQKLTSQRIGTCLWIAQPDDARQANQNLGKSAQLSGTTQALTHIRMNSLDTFQYGVTIISIFGHAALLLQIRRDQWCGQRRK
jgi:hypothetical protein